MTFKVGDRVRSVDGASIDEDCRDQVGTVEIVHSFQGEAEVLVILDDRSIRNGISLRFNPRHLLHHVDADLSTIEQVEKFLAEP